MLRVVVTVSLDCVVRFLLWDVGVWLENDCSLRSMHVLLFRGMFPWYAPWFATSFVLQCMWLWLMLSCVYTHA